jgi:hypothetical protein
MTAAGKEPARAAQNARPPQPHNALDDALATLRGYWPLLLPLVVLLPLAIFATSLWQLYFRHYQLPAIVAIEGAVPCAQFVSWLPQRAPRHCAVAFANAAGSAAPGASATDPQTNATTTPPAAPMIRRELFYFDDDSFFTMLLSPGARPVVLSHCGARGKQSWIILLGLALLGIATISNTLRTGRFFSFWPIRASPLQPHEILLLVYGAAILFGGVVGTQIAGCAAAEHAAER